MKKLSVYTAIKILTSSHFFAISSLLKPNVSARVQIYNWRKMVWIFIVTIIFGVSSIHVHGQRKSLTISQFDPRFTISAERYWSGLGGSEEYYFYVQNNTSDEYWLEIDITLNLACVGNKSFRLGVNKVAVLKPNDRFTPKSDWVHIYTSGADNFKNCRLADGKSFTLLQGVSYQVVSIKNITKQKAEDQKIQDQKLAADRKAAEEKRVREEKLAAEKKAAEEKAVQEKRVATEKQVAEKKNAEKQKSSSENKGNNSVNSSKNNSSENGTATKSRSQADNAASAKQRARDEEVTRAKAVQEAEAARLKAEQEARNQRQREYDAWKQSANEQRIQSEATAAAGSIGFLTILGQWIYNDKMGNVNPDFVYNKPTKGNRLRLTPSVEWGYSGTSIPILFQSENTTMIGGNYVTNKTLINNPIFTFNLDVNLKIGVENDNFGGYVFLAPKFGFSPIFDGYQLSLGNYGTRLFVGIKNLKLYGEYMGGERNFSKSDNDPEENGTGKIEMSYTKTEYGLRFTTNPNASYKRNHISFGMIRERMKIGGTEGYIDPISGNLITKGKSPWVDGFAFQWKKDHTFNFYFHYYPEYLVAGNVSYNSPSPSSDLRSSPTGSLIEFGFIRSFDVFAP